MRIKKKVGWIWIQIPCEGKFGSCDYDDLCQVWPSPGIECPLPFKEHGIPCECPFSPRNYSLPLSSLGTIKATSIPKWLEEGTYYVKAWLSEPYTVNAFCFQLNLSVEPRR